jgi:hypothetical protein
LKKLLRLDRKKVKRREEGKVVNLAKAKRSDLEKLIIKINL